MNLFAAVEAVGSSLLRNEQPLEANAYREQDGENTSDRPSIPNENRVGRSHLQRARKHQN